MRSTSPFGLAARCAILTTAAVMAGCATGTDSDLPDRVEFNRHIRPILSNSCYPCHGPDGGARQGELRLDVREAAIAARDGLPAIAPGNPSGSALVQRIYHTDPAERMPPIDSERRIDDRGRALLERWVEQGAEYEPHWSFVSPSRADPPAGDREDWVRNPIDGFVLARLEQEGLEPSPDAGRVTLARRLSFDVTGLPPTPDEVDAFVSDAAADAYERYVDRLLTSPRYGERMALDWLDQVRYADTNGYHSDEDRPVYPYRDYVIGAFNENLPFDQFTREQLAGDLLPSPTRRQRVASAFNRLNQITAEGGAQPKEYRAKYDADRVRTVASVWMGATLGCAECHDHKFDPFTSREFYGLGAFFADLQEEDVYIGLAEWDPFLLLPTDEEAADLARVEASIERLETRLGTAATELEREQSEWEATIRQRLATHAGGWMPARASALESTDGTVLELEQDLSILTSGPNPPEDTFIVRIPTTLERITGLRIEVMSDASFRKGYTRENLFFALHELEIDARSADGVTRRVVVSTTAADEGSSESLVDGDELTSWSVASNEKYAPTVKAVLRFARPVEGGPGAALTVRMRHLGLAMVAGHTAIGRFRLSLTTDEAAPLAGPVGIPEIVLRKLEDPLKLSEAERAAAAAYFRTLAPSLADTRRRLDESHRAMDRLVYSIDRCLISVAGEPRVTRLLPRGDWMDESGEVVQPAVPASLPPLDVDGRRPTRLDLANWLVAPDHPLTARVIVNRLWKLFFGAGLSIVLDDLGAQGEWPSHPDLLDWLAVEFVDSGWDVKHMVRLMVTSAAYRQNSTETDGLREIDPYNRLIARQSRFRLQAEMVRDTALSLAGLLSDRIGGRSVKPYQPADYWANLNFPKRIYQADAGEAQYRRGLYTHWQRSFLHPSLAAFDAPSREECVAERPISNTPQQALTLLNDPTFVEAARVFAYRIWSEGGETTSERVRWAFRQAVSREPTAEESTLLVNLYAEHHEGFASDPAAAARLLDVGLTGAPGDVEPVPLAAWTSVARAILNLHETITRS